MRRNRALYAGLVFLLCACTGAEMVEVPGACLAEQCVKAFRLDATEVTQAEFQTIMGQNPSTGPDCGSACPVESVEWAEAVEFCKRNGKRLPLSVEWEIAARGGSRAEWPSAGARAPDHAWFAENSEGRAHPVGEKEPNEFGLYDMMGNVAEWTADRHGDQGGSLRTVRGGHWASPREELRFAGQKGYMEADRGELLGFRCAAD